MCLAFLSFGRISVSQQTEPKQQPTGDPPRNVDPEFALSPEIQAMLERLLAEAADPTPPSTADSDSESSAGPQPGPLPGMVAAFQVFGQPMKIAAAGTRKYKTDTPLQVDDLVHIGSCTKAMTATMLGRLVDRQRLSFDTTIREGLPHLVDRIHQDYHDVTLRQLLMHRGGVPRDGMWAKKEGRNITERRELIVVQALANPPKHKPGTRFAYSNLGYVVAALFAAHREDRTWEQLMKREVFDVLGMQSAGFGPPGTPGKIDQPWGHLALGTAVIPRQTDNPPALGPAGTVHLTIADWAKFAFQHAGCGDPPLVTAETLKELHRGPPRQSENENGQPNDDRYACGWTVTQRGWAQGRVLTHSGSNTVWMCFLWVAPNTKTVYMAVCNAGTGPHVRKYVDRAIAGMIRLNLQ